jgi:DNA polymerase
MPSVAKVEPAARRPSPAKTPLRTSGEAADDARSLARAATDLKALEAAVRGFEGCALKATATHTVFADGNPEAPLMFVGEAPGGDEDRLGRPFVGPSGRLLDRMLAAVGWDRRSAYITNILFWRPPGNRPPTAAEIQLCLPFVERHIELVRPKIIVLLGGSAAKTLLGVSEGIVRLRGRWFNYRPDPQAAEIPLIPTYHPAYLLRSPGQKRDAWRDFLAIKIKLSELM